MSDTPKPDAVPPSDPTPLTPGQHRRLGVDLFNHVWTLLKKEARSADDDAEMIHAAHASLHHWSHVGRPVNLVRGEWQCSRVYATLARAEPAIWHAQRCLDLCAAHGIGGFDLGASHEAMARACALAGDSDGVHRHSAEAQRIVDTLNEEDERKLLRDDLATITSPRGRDGRGGPGAIGLA